MRSNGKQPTRGSTTSIIQVSTSPPLILLLLHPPASSDSFDTDLMKKKLEEILDGKQVDIPVYDFKSHTRYAVGL